MREVSRGKKDTVKEDKIQKNKFFLQNKTDGRNEKGVTQKLLTLNSRVVNSLR